MLVYIHSQSPIIPHPRIWYCVRPRRRLWLMVISNIKFWFILIHNICKYLCCIIFRFIIIDVTFLEFRSLSSCILFSFLFIEIAFMCFFCDLIDFAVRGNGWSVFPTPGNGDCPRSFINRRQQMTFPSTFSRWMTDWDNFEGIFRPSKK